MISGKGPKNRAWAWRKGAAMVALTALAALGACGGGGGGGGGDQASVEPASVAPALSMFVGQVGGSGNADGPAAQASFHGPRGVATDVAGNVYVADTQNNLIRKLTVDGMVSTLAGSGVAGFQDGDGPQASFSSPNGVAVDAAGNVYVADTGNHRIRKISPQGRVSTLAGTGVRGNADGLGSEARFNMPQALVVDAEGDVYVADTYSHQIRRITPTGQVSTWAGRGTPGSLDASGLEASFAYPIGIALDGAGNLYVTEKFNRDVRKITPAQVVSTVAGTGTSGGQDGPVGSATFDCPWGIAVDANGAVYVSDCGYDTIRMITAGQVSTLAGQAKKYGDQDGVGVQARFSMPGGLALHAGELIVADAGNSLLRKVTTSGVVSTLAGTRYVSVESVDGTGADARFTRADDMTADSQGNVYVSDTSAHTIRRVSTAGVVRTMAGLADTPGEVDGIGTVARFNLPGGLVRDSHGNLYVADQGNAVIRKMTPRGVVSTWVGNGESKDVDGQGTLAGFNSLDALAIDAQDNLYVSERNVCTVRKISPTGVVSTWAGSAGHCGIADSKSDTALFDGPQGLAVDASGNVYVADQNNHVVRKITPAGMVSTWAGTGKAGSDDGASGVATFNQPRTLAIDARGNLYVGDASNPQIRKVTPDGTVSTLVGTWGKTGFTPGALPGVIRSVTGLAVSGSTLYISQGTGIAKVTSLP
jgi:sugar lactone lactonase YvrE